MTDPIPSPFKDELEPNERYRVRNAEIELALKDIGGTIKNAIGPHMGFALLMFEMGTDKGGMFYLSNASRPDMITALEEFLENNKKEV